MINEIGLDEFDFKKELTLFGSPDPPRVDKATERGGRESCLEIWSFF